MPTPIDLILIAQTATSKAAEWESAAVLIGLSAIIAAACYGTVQIIKAIKSDTAGKAVDKATGVIRAEVMKANGVPNKFLDISPTPTWFKDTEGRMVYLNDAYVSRFNITRAEYYGANDVEVWGERIGRQFQKHDAMCRRTGRTLITIEEVPDRPHMEDTAVYRWKVIKFPIYDAVSGEFKGYGGQAYSIDHPDYEVTPITDPENMSE